MKYLYTLAIIALCFNSGAQTITTIAGTGSIACTGGGGLATAADLGDLGANAVDTSGNVFIISSSCRKIKKISAWGGITTVAGNGGFGTTGDGGPATNAAIDAPVALAVDRADNLYFCGGIRSVIRKVNPAGILSTIAGDGWGFDGDGGPATAATLNNPNGIAIDTSGNIYIADANNYRIRKISATGIITTIAGTGMPGYSGDGGAALSAQLQRPGRMAVDNSGNIYFIDESRVRKIDAGGVITSIAGNGSMGYSGDSAAATAAQLNQPEAVAADNYGNILIADAHNNVIRKVDASGIITTFAGDGTGMHGGDGGPATAARLSAPRGIAIDQNGRAYISEIGYVRKTDTCVAPGAGVLIGDSVVCSGALAALGSTAAGGAWSVNDPAVATVDEHGNVTGITPGSVTVIYAVTNSCTVAYAIKTLIVGPYAGAIDRETLYLNTAGVAILCGDGDLEISGGPAGGVWGITNTAVATISGSGFVHLLSNDQSDTAFYTVTNSCGTDTAFLPFIGRDCGDAVVHTASAEPAIAVYPNPAYDELTIASTTLVTDVAIINPIGQVAYSRKCAGNKVTVDISGLSTGIYLLRINGAVVRKFVKE